MLSYYSNPQYPCNVVGTSLSEPHTSGTALCMCVRMIACFFFVVVFFCFFLLACLQPLTINFSLPDLHVSQRLNVLDVHFRSTVKDYCGVSLKEARNKDNLS